MLNVKNLTSHEFKKRIKKEKVICFCAGQELKKLCKEYPLLASRIIYIVDNFNYNRSIEIDINSIPVISMEQLDNQIEHAILIISSIKYAKEILIQLDELQNFDGLNVYFPHLFSREQCNVVMQKGNIQLIPKKIHYFWFGNGKMPKQFQDNIDSWKKFCPDYEIICWNESNYDYTKNNYMKQAYEMKKWGFVPDYARLDIINTYGGIYLDTDVEIIKSLDDLLQYKMFCGFESSGFVAFGLGFGAITNHEILQKMMALYDETDFIKDDGSLNLTASPVYQTQILTRCGLIQNNQCQEYDDYIVFSSEYFSPIDGCGVGVPTQNTFSIHQYAASWYEEGSKKNLECIRNNVKFILSRM